MIIEAKSPNECRTCGGPILTGEQVELRFGSFHHLACVGSTEYNIAVMVDADFCLHLGNLDVTTD